MATSHTIAVSFPLATAPQVAPFVALVTRYCALIERHQTPGASDLLHQTHLLLAQLYAAGLVLPEEPEEPETDDASGETPDDADATALPSAAPDPDRLSHEAWRELYNALGAHLGVRWNYYQTILNPYVEPPEEPSTGSLADDLADVYGDLRDGLRKWERGERDAAVWHWRFHFTFHWGKHALSALGAMHELALSYDAGFPPTSGVDA